MSPFELAQVIKYLVARISTTTVTATSQPENRWFRKSFIYLAGLLTSEPFIRGIAGFHRSTKREICGPAQRTGPRAGPDPARPQSIAELSHRSFLSPAIIQQDMQIFVI